MAYGDSLIEHSEQALDFSSKTLEELMALLEKSEPVNHNDPFVLYLKEMGIEEGTIPVRVKDLVALYKKITINKAIGVCAGYLDVIYIRAIPHFKINKYVKKKKPNLTYQTMKFEYFLEENGIDAGEEMIDQDRLYNYYDLWTIKTKKKSPFDKEEFIAICNKYFIRHRGKFGINKQL